MINAIIIDDEPLCCKTLETLLKRYCPEVMVLKACTNGLEGLAAIPQLKPDLVFLDVEMPKMNGFEMLEQLPAVNFHLIFVTSYDAYALKAIKVSAIDYLLKPLDREELQNSVQKVINRREAPLPEQLKIILDKMKHPSAASHKIALPTMEGLQMVPVKSIISCEANDNYTTLVLKNSNKIVVSSTLKVIEELLDDHSFLRVHRSFLVNLDEIEKYVKGDGGYLVMSDNAHIYISRTNKEMLLKKLIAKNE
ncbi:MAG: DNA-binding response regulator [Chitinophagaceae bacterium]|nr:DNA-binding response regulator [Chitinophagaceae bacterium]